MSALDAALVVLVVHGALGGFDTLYCHEWQARLPKQRWAANELGLHSTRSFFYAIIFIGLAWFEWRGAFTWLLLAVLTVEWAVTLRDAAIEDRTRRLSRAERLVHMTLGGTTGAYVALVLYYASTEWIAAPTELKLTDHGAVSLILSAYAVAVTVSAVRDFFASRRLLAANTSA